MKLRGASPIIATVLLLAITLIAVVGLWYTSQGIMAKSQGSSSTPQSINVISCDLGGNLVVRNQEAREVKNSTVFKVSYYSNRSTVGYFNVSINATQGMLGMATITRNTSQMRESNYIAEGNGFITDNFNCK